MNTAVTRSDWVGRVIDGRFPLLDWLGSSEKAGVFRTELTEPQNQSAVIKLLPVEGENPEVLLRDWESAAKLSHPHLMRIFQSGRTNVGDLDLLYVVTEYAEESLAQVIPERPLSTGEARAMLVPILDGLSYLHAQGLVHRHLRPSNVMVVDDKIKLPIEGVRPAGGKAGPAVPSPYDAPEIAAGNLSPAGDVWSVGITLVEALTQNPPQWDRSKGSDPAVPAEIPEPFAGIAAACLRSEPTKRASLPQIRGLLAGKPSAAEPGSKTAQPLAAEVAERTRTTSPRKAWIVAGIVAIIALIAFLLLRPRPPEPATAQKSPSTPAAVPSQPPPSTPAPAPAQTAPSTSTASPAPSAPETAPSPASPPAPQPAAGGAGAKGDIAQRVMPDVAASANRTIHGTVTVRVRLNVDANGAVSDATFDAPGPSRYFSAKALDAARKWQFKAARKDGQAIPSVWMLRFDFKRDGPEVSAQEVSP